VASQDVPVASRQVLIGYEPRLKPGFFPRFISEFSVLSVARCCRFAPCAGKFAHTAGVPTATMSVEIDRESRLRWPPQISGSGDGRQRKGLLKKVKR
jgi:hypothetical protein